MRYFVPERVIRGLHDGTCAKIDYHSGNRATACFSDGRLVRFSTLVTQAMLVAEHEAWKKRVQESGALVYSVTFKSTIDHSGYRGVVGFPG